MILSLCLLLFSRAKAGSGARRRHSNPVRTGNKTLTLPRLCGLTEQSKHKSRNATDRRPRHLLRGSVRDAHTLMLSFRNILC